MQYRGKIKIFFFLIFLFALLLFLNIYTSFAADLTWNTPFYQDASSQYVAAATWLSKGVAADSVITSIQVNISGLPASNRAAGDACVFISRPIVPYYYPATTGGFAETICNHFDRSGQSSGTASPWAWQATSSEIFVPAGSEITCGSTLWSSSGYFPSNFGNFSCTVSLADATGRTGTRVLRFPYIDQWTNTALPAQKLKGESAQSPWVGYKSSVDFPLKIKKAAFFVGFPYNVDSGVSMCLYWYKNGSYHKQECFNPSYQWRLAYTNYDGYSQFLDLNWDLAAGDEIFGGCTYFGASGSNSDCAIYAFAELPSDKRDFEGVFTSYGIIDPGQANNYCYDSFNRQSFTHPYFHSSPDPSDSSLKCMGLLRLYDPLEVTLISDKSQGYIGDTVQLTTQHKRGQNPQYKFWFSDGTNYQILKDWSSDGNFNAQIKNVGVNNYYGVHIKEENRVVYAGDFDAQNWVSVQGITSSDTTPPAAPTGIIIN